MRIIARTIQILGFCFMLAALALFAQPYLNPSSTTTSVNLASAPAPADATVVAHDSAAPQAEATIFDAIAEYWAQLTGKKEDKKKYGFKNLGNNNKLASAPSFSGIKPASAD